MKIIRIIYIFFSLLFISSTLYAGDECNAQDNIPKIKSRISEVIANELSHYYLRRNLVFPNFSYDYFKAEVRWGYDQAKKGMASQEILELQKKRYANIYSTINQQFFNKYLDSSEFLLQEELDSEFKVFSKYEKLLSPLIQKQLQIYNDDFLKEVEGKISSRVESTWQDVLDEEQKIKDIVSHKFKLSHHSGHTMKKNNENAREILVCKMMFKNNNSHEMTLEYLIAQFEDDPEKFIEITGIVERDKLHKQTDFGYYFIHFFDFQ